MSAKSFSLLLTTSRGKIVLPDFSKPAKYLCLALIFCAAGCNAPKSHLSHFNESFKNDCSGQGNFEESTYYAISKIKDCNHPRGEDLLWSMQAAYLERMKQNYRQSNDYFDKSENALNFFDHQNKLADSVAATAVNDNIVPYLGEEYDGIMINTYKAINFMALGQNDLARVEFNRALDRQRRAVENFSNEIQKLKKELDTTEKENKQHVEKTLENPEIQNLIAGKYPALNEFQAYPDFVNPFTTYIAGVYFVLIEENEKAVDLFKKSFGMVGDNRYIAEDLAAVEGLLNDQKKLQNTLWVIFENGMGPVKKEFRIDLPLFIATEKVKYAGIALPKLEFREQAYPYLHIKADGQDYKTQVVADMDRIIQTEFKKDFNGILTRAIISATAKAVAQYALEEQSSNAGSLASIGMAIYSFATTAADVRIWTTLPKDFQVARMPIPSEKLIIIEPPEGQPIEIKLPDCKNALVYVRIPYKNSIAIYNVITY